MAARKGIDELDDEMETHTTTEEFHGTPLEKLRNAVLEESAGVIDLKNLGRAFRLFDDNGNQRVDYKEFRKGLREIGVKLTTKDIRDMFIYLDKDKSGSLDFDEFLIAMKPPTPHKRMVLIEKAFDKLDRNGEGSITIDDIKIAYNTSEHPELQSIEWKGATGLEAMLNTFSVGKSDSKVTRQDFINYYTGISCAMKNDAQFKQMLKHSWNL